jgi:hypothetical protein
MVSQALANLESVARELAGLSGLPQDADAARTTVEASITALVPVVTATSQTVVGFVATATPLADKAASALAAGDAQGVVDALGGIQAASPPAGTSVAQATQALQATMGSVNAQAGTLANAESALQGQITQATNELNQAQASADELDKKKYYWLALGPFGLIGLGICIGMIVDATNRVNGILQRVSALRAQVAQWTKMKADMDLVAGDLPQLATKLQSLQNGLDFVGSDITAVLDDVRSAGSGSAIAKAYILTTQAELATLRADAS